MSTGKRRVQHFPSVFHLRRGHCRRAEHFFPEFRGGDSNRIHLQVHVKSVTVQPNLLGALLPRTEKRRFVLSIMEHPIHERISIKGLPEIYE